MLRSFDDSRIFGESYGTGPTRVVWLHGWARDSGDFSTAARSLAERGIASVALDLPGFGASPTPELAGGARHYAELILPALRDLGGGRLVLVGHSLGGRIAVVVASQHPELFDGLVVTGAPLVRLRPPARSPLGYRVLRSLARRHLVSGSRLEAARQKYGSRDYRNAQGIIRDVLVATVRETYESELSALDVPITFLWGESDLEAPVEVATRSAAMVKRSTKVQVLEGVGHFVPFEATDVLVDVTEELLRQ
ncbi:MAG: alpha/beta fold hydrolase [Acidimicrobiales bacterium]